MAPTRRLPQKVQQSAGWYLGQRVPAAHYSLPVYYSAITLCNEVKGGFILHVTVPTSGRVVSPHCFPVFPEVAVASYVLKVLSGLSPFVFLQGSMNLVVGFGKHVIGVSGQIGRAHV